MRKKIFPKDLPQKASSATKSKNEKALVDKTHFREIISDLTSAKSILFKLVGMFLFLIIIPVATIGGIAVNTASSNLLSSSEGSVTSASMQTTKYFDAFFAKASDTSMQLIANTALQAYNKDRESDMADYDKLAEMQNARDVLSAMNNSSKDIVMNVLYYDSVVLGDMLSPRDMEKVKAAGWFKKVMYARGKAVWIDRSDALEEATSRKTAVTLARSLNDTSSSKNVGILFVDIKYESIIKILSDIKIGEEDATYLITPEGQVLSGKGETAQNELTSSGFIKEVINKSAKEEKQNFYFDIDGTRHLVAFNKSATTGFIAVTIIPSSVITAGATQILRTTILAGIIFILIAGTIGFIFSLRMTLSMKALMKVMEKAENGDLTASLTMKRKDEIGRLVTSFNRMLVKISELVKQSKQAAIEVGVSSGKMADISNGSSRISTEIAHAIVEVASGSSNQASEIETSVKNVKQLTDRIKFTVEKTKVMENDSESMKELLGYGIATIEKLNKKTEQTNVITSNVVKEIAQLNQMVKNINVITNVLRSIADQTNLLALNAAIEAARAGDAGKGFAVVADEIRKLAEQSNNHTKDIQKHIETIFKQAQSSTELVTRAEASIKEQSEMVSQTAEVFSRIDATTSILTENISKVGNMITDMDAYKEMVMSSMENISAVSEQVSASTQEVSASTEEQLASIEQLDFMAKQLNALAGKLVSDMDKFQV